MTAKHTCKKCGYPRASVFYYPPERGWRFLWWHSPDKPERHSYWCLGCSFKEEVPVSAVHYEYL